MIHFKNNFTSHSGFTLVEVLLALAITALVLTPLFTSQSSIFAATVRYSQLMQRILVADTFLQESHRVVAPDTQQVTFEKQHAIPQAQLVYGVNKVADNSVLKNFSDMYVEKVSFTWMDGNRKRQSVIGGFVHKPKKRQP